MTDYRERRKLATAVSQFVIVIVCVAAWGYGWPAWVALTVGWVPCRVGAAFFIQPRSWWRA